ncbi:MAG: hypothetical protein QM714_01265 [Nocardioides sp.]|uniref:hypothetical protein n=1 Tax=Nocardioides sp. TaxID=35761 RepID=UPI0039E230B0
MAKALIGYLSNDRRSTDRLATDNARLRARIGELEQLVLRLQEENDSLLSQRAEQLLVLDEEMQPA